MVRFSSTVPLNNPSSANTAPRLARYSCSPKPCSGWPSTSRRPRTRMQARHHLQQRRFAGAGFADDGDRFMAARYRAARLTSRSNGLPSAIELDVDVFEPEAAADGAVDRRPGRHWFRRLVEHVVEPGEMRAHDRHLQQVEDQRIHVGEERSAQREERVENPDRDRALHHVGDADIERGDGADHEHHMQQKSVSMVSFLERKPALANRVKLSNHFRQNSSPVLWTFSVAMSCSPSISRACSSERASSVAVVYSAILG